MLCRYQSPVIVLVLAVRFVHVVHAARLGFAFTFTFGTCIMFFVDSLIFRLYLGGSRPPDPRLGGCRPLDPPLYSGGLHLQEPPRKIRPTHIIFFSFIDPQSTASNSHRGKTSVIKCKVFGSDDTHSSRKSSSLVFQIGPNRVPKP